MLKLKLKIIVILTLTVGCLAIGHKVDAFKKIPKSFADTDSITKQDSISDYLKNFIPTLDPEIVSDRLTCLQKSIKLTYNKQILSWIEFYTHRNRDYAQRMLEKSAFYFPIFEEALKRHNMPDELKYLSIVESALTPKAASWAAAVGLWQFIPSTGKEYGLHQDWYIDERMDIYKSTDAACRYLKFLYNYHGDWQLALAAYNCGPGRVNWAVKQAGGKGADFWTIYKYLPGETRGYVPAFIAACYAMNYADQYFIFAKKPETHIPSDTILISQFLNVEEFAKQIEVPKEQMEKLNPHLKKNAIPAYKKNYPLRFPAEKRAYLDQNRNAILKASSFASRREMFYTPGNDVDASSTEGKNKITHTVANGESLSYIGLKYGATASSIQVWNRLPNQMIYPSQQLVIWTKQKPVTQTVVAQNTKSTNQIQNTPAGNVGNVKVHVIKSGDSLWSIAQKYEGATIDQIKKLNKITEKSMLMPGQKIMIPSK